MTVYSFVRSLDIFTTPVGIRYKNSKDYQTACGGLISLFALLAIGFFAVSELVAFIGGNTYNESLVIENLNYNNTR